MGFLKLFLSKTYTIISKLQRQIMLGQCRTRVIANTCSEYCQIPGEHVVQG